MGTSRHLPRHRAQCPLGIGRMIGKKTEKVIKDSCSTRWIGSAISLLSFEKIVFTKWLHLTHASQNYAIRAQNSPNFPRVVRSLTMNERPLLLPSLSMIARVITCQRRRMTLSFRIMHHFWNRTIQLKRSRSRKTGWNSHDRSPRQAHICVCLLILELFSRPQGICYNESAITE